MQHVVRYTTDCVASLLPFVPSFFSFLFSHLKQGKSLLRIIEKLLWCSYNSCASISRVYPVFFFFSFLSFFFFFCINPPASRSKRREGMKTGWYLIQGVDTRNINILVRLIQAKCYGLERTATVYIITLCGNIYIYIYNIYILQRTNYIVP